MSRPNHKGASHLSIQLQHKAQHTVGCRVLWAKVDGHIADFLLDGGQAGVPSGHLHVLALDWDHGGALKLLHPLRIREPFGSTTTLPTGRDGGRKN